MKKVIQYGAILVLLVISLGILYYVDDIRYAQIRAGNQGYYGGRPGGYLSGGSSSSGSSASNTATSSSGLAQTSSSDSEPTSESCVLRVESPSVVPPNSTFSVSIIAENIPFAQDNGDGMLYGWELVLKWNPDVVVCTTEMVNLDVWQAFLGPWVISPIDNTIGSYHQSLTARAPSAPVAGTFWLANLTFATADTPINFETDLNLTHASGYVYCLLDRESNEIRHYYVGGHVEINGFYLDSIMRTPAIPSVGDEVKVSFKETDIITDDTAKISYAFLSYSTDLAWHNVSMNKYGCTFEAIIPAYPFGTIVQYEISANDTNGNSYWSNTYSYTIIDSRAPEIAIVVLEPTCPYPYVPSNMTRSNEPTLVKANISELGGAGGVAAVYLSYRVDGSEWWNTTMVYASESDLWAVIVPGQAGNTTVEFRVVAYDKAGNEAIYSALFTVTALSVGDINGDGNVDASDLDLLNAHLWQPSQ